MPKRLRARYAESLIRLKGAPVLVRVTVISLFLGLGAGAWIGSFDIYQYLSVRGHAPETATIIASRWTGIGCGRGSSPHDVTWRSNDPPPGMPTTFTEKGTCHDSEVGRTHRLVRILHDDGSLSVYLDPPGSLLGVLEPASEAFGLSFGFFLVALGLIDNFLGTGAANRKRRAQARGSARC